MASASVPTTYRTTSAASDPASTALIVPDMQKEADNKVMLFIAQDAIKKAEEAISVYHHEVKAFDHILKKGYQAYKSFRRQDKTPNKKLDNLNVVIKSAVDAIDNVILMHSAFIFNSFFVRASENPDLNALKDHIFVLKFLFQKKFSLLHWDSKKVNCRCLRHFNKLIQIEMQIKRIQKQTHTHLNLRLMEGLAPKSCVAAASAPVNVDQELHRIGIKLKSRELRDLLIDYFKELERDKSTFTYTGDNAKFHHEALGWFQGKVKFFYKNVELFIRMNPELFSHTQIADIDVFQTQMEQLRDLVLTGKIEEFKAGIIQLSNDLNGAILPEYLVKGFLTGAIIYSKELVDKQIEAHKLVGVPDEYMKYSLSIDLKKQLVALQWFVDTLAPLGLDYLPNEKPEVDRNIFNNVDPKRSEAIIKIIMSSGLGFFKTNLNNSKDHGIGPEYNEADRRRADYRLAHFLSDEMVRWIPFTLSHVSTLLECGFNLNIGNIINDASQVEHAFGVPSDLACLRVYFGAMDAICKEEQSTNKFLEELSKDNGSPQFTLKGALLRRRAILPIEMDSEEGYECVREFFQSKFPRDLISLIKQFMLLDGLQIVRWLWQDHINSMPQLKEADVKATGAIRWC